MKYDIGSFLGRIVDCSDIAQINWCGRVGSDDDGADVGGVAQKRAGFDEKLGVSERPGSCR